MELDAVEHCMHVILGDEWRPVAGFISVGNRVVGGMSGDQAAW